MREFSGSFFDQHIRATPAIDNNTTVSLVFPAALGIKRLLRLLGVSAIVCLLFHNLRFEQPTLPSFGFR